MERPVEKARMVEVNGVRFDYIKERSFTREGAVFRSEDRESYLRTGKESYVWGEANMTRDLCRRGFPVPKVLEVGEMQNGFSYYVERSLGNRTFGSRCKEETERFGLVQEGTFNAYAAVIEKVFEAQCKRDNILPQDLETLDSIANVSGVVRRNPPPEKLWPVYEDMYQRVRQTLSELPWGFVHRDLNPYNVLPRGVIDLEIVTAGPIGYDVSLAVLSQRIRRPYLPVWESFGFTPLQMQSLSRRIDEVAAQNNIPPVSKYASEFMLLRIMQMSGWNAPPPSLSPAPELDLAWRTELRDWCVKQYVATGKINPLEFPGIKE